MKRVLYQLGVAVFCVICICLLVRFQHKRTYAEDVEDFEARARKNVDPDLLQIWAVDLIRDQAKKTPPSEDTLSYEIKDVPKMLRGLEHNFPAAFVFVNRKEEYSCVVVNWGSGFEGHWAFISDPLIL